MLIVFKFLESVFDKNVIKSKNIIFLKLLSNGILLDNVFGRIAFNIKKLLVYLEIFIVSFIILFYQIVFSQIRKNYLSVAA